MFSYSFWAGCTHLCVRHKIKTLHHAIVSKKDGLNTCARCNPDTAWMQWCWEHTLDSSAARTHTHITATQWTKLTCGLRPCIPIEDLCLNVRLADLKHYAVLQHWAGSAGSGGEEQPKQKPQSILAGPAYHHASLAYCPVRNLLHRRSHNMSSMLVLCGWLCVVECLSALLSLPVIARFRRPICCGTPQCGDAHVLRKPGYLD